MHLVRAFSCLALASCLLASAAIGCDSEEDGDNPKGEAGGGTTTTTGMTSGTGGMGGGGTTTTTTPGTGGSTSSSGGDQEPAEMQGMTAAHNAVRAGVNPPADPPIPPLSWSGEVAAVAQAYAEQCNFDHSSGPYGENLYATSGGGSPEDVVGSWASEAANYNHANNSCSGTCGHYTQVVWADSTQLGCGVANCTTGSPFGGGSWQFWVCNYNPPGNYVGERPY